MGNESEDRWNCDDKVVHDVNKKVRRQTSLKSRWRKGGKVRVNGLLVGERKEKKSRTGKGRVRVSVSVSVSLLCVCSVRRSTSLPWDAVTKR